MNDIGRPVGETAFSLMVGEFDGVILGKAKGELLGWMAKGTAKGVTKGTGLLLR